MRGKKCTHLKDHQSADNVFSSTNAIAVAGNAQISGVPAIATTTPSRCSALGGRTA